MTYSADTFINDLHEADNTKSGTRKIKARKRNRNRKAYSDHDVMDVEEELLLVAENLANFYAKKDAKGAVEYARKQWLRQQQDTAYQMAKEAVPKAIKSLLAGWKEEGHI